MKKIITLMFLSLILFSSLPKVNAATITVEDVVDKLKSNDFVGEMDVYQSVKDNSTITLKDNSIEIISKGEASILSRDATTVFNYQDGIISYKFSGDINNSEDIGNNLVDTIWMVHLIYVVGELKGYSETEITNFINEMENENNFTFANNGIEMKTVEYNWEGENVSGTYIDTFKINLNNFKIKEVTNNNNQNTNNDLNNDVDNPQTGELIPYIILGVGISLIITFFSYSKNKNKVFKI